MIFSPGLFCIFTRAAVMQSFFRSPFSLSFKHQNGLDHFQQLVIVTTPIV